MRWISQPFLTTLRLLVQSQRTHNNETHNYCILLPQNSLRTIHFFLVCSMMMTLLFIFIRWVKKTPKTDNNYSIWRTSCCIYLSQSIQNTPRHEQEEREKISDKEWAKKSDKLLWGWGDHWACTDEKR